MPVRRPVKAMQLYLGRLLVQHLHRRPYHTPIAMDPSCPEKWLAV